MFNNLKNIIWISIFTIIFIACGAMSFWQHQRLQYKLALHEKIQAINNNKININSDSVNLGNLQVLENNFQIHTTSIALFPHFKNKNFGYEIILLASNQELHLPIDIGFILDEKMQIDNQEFKNKLQQMIENNIAEIQHMSLILWKPKQSWFFNNNVEKGIFKKFNTDDLEKYWQTTLSDNFLLIPLDKRHESIFYPDNIKINHHKFYRILWLIYGMMALIIMIMKLNFKNSQK